MKKRIILALILMGFTSLIVQIVLVREFLITFYGNELIIGIILANWIILEALGSGLSSRPSLKVKNPLVIYALLQLGICLYLPCAIYIIRIIKNILNVTAGEGIGILPVFFASFAILAPLSIFDGSQFPFGCRIWSDHFKKRLESAGKVYILEALGFIIAGPIFTYLLITRLHSFEIAFILGLVNLISAALLLTISRRRFAEKTLLTLVSIVASLYIFAFFGPLNKIHDYSIARQWKGLKILEYRNSIYANLLVTQAERQYTFYSDGVPIINLPVPNISFNEEFAHFVLLSHKDPREILLLSGGAGGLINEIIKYPLRKIDYAELDPLLIKLIKKYPTQISEDELNNPYLNIKHIDGRRFARITKSNYDVIITNLPHPSTLQLNRFYTREFFRIAKSKLKKNGIFSFHLPGSLSYISQELRNLNASILKTLEEEFNYVEVIPGDFNIYLASKQPLDISSDRLIERIKQSRIKTKSLSPQYIKLRLNHYWMDWFDSSIETDSAVRENEDLLPSGVFYSIDYWNSLFNPKLKLLFEFIDKLNIKFLFLFLGLLGAGLLWLQKNRSDKKLSIGFAIGTTGFVGMSLELILIFSFQSYYGYVFHYLALLTTAFMAGLTLGGWQMTQKLSKIKDDLSYFKKLESLITGLCLITAPLLMHFDRSYLWQFSFIFFIIAGISGFLIGLEFPLANKIWLNDRKLKHAAGILYSFDLCGAWLASLFASLALVPVIGVLNTCFFLAALKIISLLIIKG